jgi:hypothetical protein
MLPTPAPAPQTVDAAFSLALWPEGRTDWRLPADSIVLILASDPEMQLSEDFLESLNAIWGVPDGLCDPGELLLDMYLVDVYYEIQADTVAAWAHEVVRGTLEWYGQHMPMETQRAVEAIVRLLTFWAGQREIDDGTVTMAGVVGTLLARTANQGVCRIPLAEDLARVYEEISALPPTVSLRPFRLPHSFYAVVPGVLGDLDILDWLHVLWHQLGESLVAACESPLTQTGMPNSRAAVAHLGPILRLFASAEDWGGEGTIVWRWHDLLDNRRRTDILALQCLARHPRHRLREIYTDSSQGILYELTGFLAVLDAGPLITLLVGLDAILGPILFALHPILCASTVGLVHDGPSGHVAFDVERRPHRLSGEGGRVVVTAENLTRYAEVIHHGAVILTKMVLTDAIWHDIATHEIGLDQLARDGELLAHIMSLTREERQALRMMGPGHATQDLLRNSFEATRAGRLLRRMELLGHSQDQDEYRDWALATCDIAYLLLRYWKMRTSSRAHHRGVPLSRAWEKSPSEEPTDTNTDETS